MPPRDIESLKARWTGRTLERRYRLDRVVGHGGFGIVLEGRHLTLDVPIAVKVLHVTPEMVGRERHADVLASFIEEARIVARLRHPNIVTVLDSGVTSPDPAPTEALDEREGDAGAPAPSAPWIVMDWCNGTPLDVDLDARRGLGGRTIEETWRLLGPIVEAVGYAHERGVVHRDIKPSNVMLDVGPAGRITPRLLDFGIAKYMEPGDVAGSGVTATQSTWRTFTPAYAAIEQRVGGRTGPWTDVYALALLFVEMLTDAAPQGAEDPAVAAVTANRPTPAAHGVDVGAWEAVLEKALAVRPSDRHANAGELFAALEAALPARGSAPSDLGVSRSGEAVVVAVTRGQRVVAADAETDAAPAPPAATQRLPAPAALPRKVAIALAAALVIGSLAWGLSRLAGTEDPAGTAAPGDDVGATGQPARLPVAESPPVPTGTSASTAEAPPAPVVVTPTTGTSMPVTTATSAASTKTGRPGPAGSAAPSTATAAVTHVPPSATLAPPAATTSKPRLY